MERQEDPLMTGKKTPQEKEGLGRKSDHRKNPEPEGNQDQGELAKT